LSVKTFQPQAERRANDFYPTQQRCADRCVACLPRQAIPPRPFVLDVGSGPGAFGRAVRASWPEAVIWGVELGEQRKGWLGIDGLLDLSAYNHVIYGDYQELSEELTEAQYAGACRGGFGVDLVVGNPPYSIDEAAVAFGMQVLRPGGWMAFLLLEAFAHSEIRYDRFYSRKPYAPVAILPLVQRPSFFKSAKGSSTDYREYAWFIWRKDPAWPLPTLSGQLDWKRPATVSDVGLLPGLEGLEAPDRFNPAAQVVETLETTASLRRLLIDPCFQQAHRRAYVLE